MAEDAPNIFRGSGSSWESDELEVLSQNEWTRNIKNIPRRKYLYFDGTFHDAF